MESGSSEDAPTPKELVEKVTSQDGGETPQPSGRETEQDNPHEYLSGVTLLLVFASLTLAVFLYFMDASIVATATPGITAQFHSTDDISWYGASYMLTTSAVQPLSGKIYSYFNVKWSFLVFFAIFELGSALCGAATSSTMLIVGRAVAGIGASGLQNGAFIIIALTVPVAKQAGFRGLLLGLSALGLLTGPLVGGALTEYTTWRWCFYINLPCGAVIALAIALIPFPDYHIAGDGSQSLAQKLAKLDLCGFLLFVPCVLMLMLPLQWGGTKFDWHSATIIGLFCGFAGNLALFVAWQLYMGRDAMIPPHLVRQRIVWTSCLNLGFMGGFMFVTVYFFPEWFQSVKDMSPEQSGVGVLPYEGVILVLTILTGGLIGRLGYYLPFALASGLLTSVGTGLVTTLTPTSSTARRVGYQMVQGCMGFGFQIPILAVQHHVNKEDISVASGMVVLSNNLSGAVFLAIAQAIFGTELRHFLGVYAPSLDAGTIISAGTSAAAIRSVVPAELLDAVRLAYSDTFNHVMYLALGAACAAAVCATGMGWVRIPTEELR